MHRAAFVLLSALVLAVLPEPSPAVPSTCAELAVSDGAVARLWADYTAYEAAHDKTGALISGKAFSHELDVAGGYLEGCPDPHLRAQYHLYALRVSLDSFRVLDTIAEKRDAARGQADDLSALYRYGFAKEDPAGYARLKASVMANHQALGMEFRSPENGKVVVARNSAVADCKRNDHRAELLAPVVVSPPAQLLSDRAYQGERYATLFVEKDGTLMNGVSIDVRPVGSAYDEHFETAHAVDDAIVAALTGLKLRPMVSQCVPAPDTVYVRFSIANGTITAAPRPVYTRP